MAFYYYPFIGLISLKCHLDGRKTADHQSIRLKKLIWACSGLDIKKFTNAMNSVIRYHYKSAEFKSLKVWPNILPLVLPFRFGPVFSKYPSRYNGWLSWITVWYCKRNVNYSWYSGKTLYFWRKTNLPFSVFATFAVWAREERGKHLKEKKCSPRRKPFNKE